MSLFVRGYPPVVSTGVKAWEKAASDGFTAAGVYRVLPRLAGVSRDDCPLRERTGGECRPRQEPRKRVPSHDSSHGG